MIIADSLTLTLHKTLSNTNGLSGADQILCNPGKVVRMADAFRFSEKSNPEKSKDKFGIGPIHFSYFGWGYENIVAIHSNT